LANITLRDILCNFSLHTSPPKVLFQILVHLGTARVHREFWTDEPRPIFAYEAYGPWVQRYAR
jgi:hypothetical protein